MYTIYSNIATLDSKSLCGFFEGKEINSQYDLYAPALHVTDYCDIYIGKKHEDKSLWALKVFELETYENNMPNIEREREFQVKFGKAGISPLALTPIISGEHYFIPMELMNGCSLKDQLSILGTILEPELKEITKFLIEALSILATHGIIHNSIRPSQILVKLDQKSGKPIYKLSGFEDSKYESEDDQFPIGSGPYASPEMSKGKYTRSADIWSVGITLYELCSGKLPSNKFIEACEDFSSESPPKDLSKFLEFPGDVSIELREFIIFCLNPDPKKRPGILGMKKHPFICASEPDLPPPIDYKKDFCGFVKDTIKKVGFNNFDIEVKHGIYSPYVLTKQVATTNYGSINLCYKKNPSNSSDKDDLYIMKIIKSSKLTDSKSAERVIQELGILRKISNSPYCICLRDFFIWSNGVGEHQLCMILEYCNGGNLKEYLSKAKTRTTLEEIKPILWNVACGLRELHRLNIIHRGVEPSNVLLIINDGQIVDAKLSDFGLGRVLTESGSASTIIASTDYMAPEVRRAMKEESFIEYNNKVDNWAFGILMHLLCYGKTPYETGLNKPKDILEGKEMIFPPFKIDLYKDYFELMAKCLKNNPENRLSIHQIVADPYFESVIIPKRKEFKPYSVREKPIPGLSNNLFHCEKSGIKQPFMAKRINGATLTEFSKKALCKEISSMIRVRNCANILKLYDYFQYKGDVYLIMENISSCTLKDYVLKEYRNITVDSRRKLIFEILRALLELHDHKIYHRAVSPFSIIVGFDKSKKQIHSVRLGDFGRAKLLITEEATNTVFTDEYSAPELATADTPTAAVDIWSFGILIYFLSFGANLLDIKGNDRMKLRNGIYRIPDKVPDPELINIMRKCLHPKPDMRITGDQIYEAFMGEKRNKQI